MSDFNSVEPVEPSTNSTNSTSAKSAKYCSRCKGHKKVEHGRSRWCKCPWCDGTGLASSEKKFGNNS